MGMKFAILYLNEQPMKFLNVRRTTFWNKQNANREKIYKQRHQT